MPLYVIEHLEPELWEWSLLEYKHVSRIVGKKNLLFSNVKKGSEKLKPYGKVTGKSVAELELDRPCLLDPRAGSVLKTSDKFETFVFGGILGDHPPRKRTGLLARRLSFPRRNLGKKQMSTDTAVFVAKMINDGVSFRRIPFKDGVEVWLGSAESVILPYRYVLKNNKPVLTPGIKKLLKKGF